MKARLLWGNRIFWTGVFVFFLALTCNAQGPGDKIIKEILIQVQPGIIVLPENIEIEKVPVSAARVRSTELRDLNSQYHVVNIERLYEIEEKSSGLKTKRAVSGDLASKKQTPAAGQAVDLSRVFTKKTRDKLKGSVQSGREEIVQASDTFLLQLEFDAGQVVDMAPIVDAYKQLPVIIYAEYVTRQK